MSETRVYPLHTVESVLDYWIVAINEATGTVTLSDSGAALKDATASIVVRYPQALGLGATLREALLVSALRIQGLGVHVVEYSVEPKMSMSQALGEKVQP